MNRNQNNPGWRHDQGRRRHPKSSSGTPTCKIPLIAEDLKTRAEPRARTPEAAEQPRRREGGGIVAFCVSMDGSERTRCAGQMAVSSFARLGLPSCPQPHRPIRIPSQDLSRLATTGLRCGSLAITQLSIGPICAHAPIKAVYVLISPNAFPARSTELPNLPNV